MKYRLIWGAPLLAYGGWVSPAQGANHWIEFAGAAPEIAQEVTSSPAAQGSPATATPNLSFKLPTPEKPAAIAPPTPASPALAVADTPAEATLPLPPPAAPAPITTTAAPPLPPLAPEAATLFDGEADSLVAIAVGSAEGTRTPHGDRTPAYYGHIDPGNQAWNQGSFSYQHGAPSPEVADQYQLERLKQHTKELHHQAFKRGMALTLAELLNGIDLANQAPLAALDQGYIDWLAIAKTMNLSPEDTILWARTRSFLDPDTQRWNAPGLGNSVQTITADQARRQRAIAQAIATYQQPLTSAPADPSPAAPAKPVAISEEAIDLILWMEHPP